MPLPWKKARSGRISRLMVDLQQSPKHGGSLVVETGFPTSLIDLFVKNRDRLKKPSSRSRQSSPLHPPSSPPRRSSPPRPLARRSSFPPPLPPPRVEPVEREAVARDKIEERVAGENESVGGGSACFLMVALKVLVVAVLALSTKKLTVGITLSALALLFLEFAAPRAYTCLRLCPDALSLLDSFIQRRRKGQAVAIDHKSARYCEITETFEDSRDCTEGIRVPEPYTDAVSCSEPASVTLRERNSGDSSVSSSEDWKRARVAADREGQTQTIRDLVFVKERSRSSKLKSRIVKKIVPKKLRSSMKKKAMKSREEKEQEEEEEGGGSMTEVSSIVSDDKSERIGSEISERDDDYSSPPLLESCSEVEESQDGSSKGSSKNSDKGNAIVLFVIVLVGLLGGKLLAIGMFLSWCLILRSAGISKVQEQPV